MPKLTSDDFEELVGSTESALKASGWAVQTRETIPYGRSIRLERGGVVNLYNGKKGAKAVLAGKLLDHERQEIEAIVSALVETPAIESKNKAAAISVKGGSLLGISEPWIGSDEAGKGDFFGPLVVCACAMKPELVEEAAAQGVQDSKNMTTKQIYEAATWLESNTLSKSIVLMPVDYNQRYAEFLNLNKMLGAMHARIILSLYEETKVGYVLSDKFGPTHHITKHFTATMPKFDFHAMTKAERDIGVAGASILARAKFLDAMKTLSTEATMDLPLGAGAPVKKAAKEFLAAFGPEELAKYAKMHFKTAAQIGAREFTAKELGQR